MSAGAPGVSAAAGTRTVLREDATGWTALVIDHQRRLAGSVTVDQDLLDAAGLLEGEQVHIVDINNGNRLETYTIAGERGSGIVSVNGAAARKAAPGDLLIVVSYGVLTEDEVRYFQPRLVYVDARNRILSERAAIPGQLAA